MPRNARTTPPLILDFDGTLHRGDLFWEGFAWALKHDWLLLVSLIAAFARGGRVASKNVVQTALRHKWAPVLPWDERVEMLAAQAEKAGRKVYVVSGGSQGLVEDAVRARGHAWPVWGTGLETGNLTSKRKAAKLVKEFGQGGFDYAGNSLADIPVWQAARKAIVVNPFPLVEGRARAHGNVQQVLPVKQKWWRALFKALRPHLWVKNLLVTVPLVNPHMAASPMIWQGVGLAFVAFSLCASGMYLLRDMLDVVDDRLHPTRQHRPLAAGTLFIPIALLMSVLLVLTAIALACLQGPWLVGVLGVYVAGAFVSVVSSSRWPVAGKLLRVASYGVRLMAGYAVGLSHLP